MVGDAPRFVSRGGDKLDGALAMLEVIVEGRRWIDLGASTGGFTDRLLQGGAAAVCAVDVGYGQLDWKLRNDPRVTVIERTNARELTLEDVPWAADGIVGDLSFISLTLVLPAMVRVATGATDYVLLVKPQFEVGKGEVGKGGVVTDPNLWLESMTRVSTGAEILGLGVVAAVPSPLVGPAGNHEFFLHLRPGEQTDPALLAAAVEAVG